MGWEYDGYMGAMAAGWILLLIVVLGGYRLYRRRTRSEGK